LDPTLEGLAVLDLLIALLAKWRGDVDASPGRPLVVLALVQRAAVLGAASFLKETVLA